MRKKNISLRKDCRESRMPRRAFLLMAAALTGSLLLAGRALHGQQEPKITSQVKLVTVYATVRDKHGKIAPNLNKEDFVLDEDGHAQTISNFVRDSDLPLTLGLLVDTSLSQRHVLNSERDASYTFLDHMLREDKDKAFLIHFDWQVELLRDLTSSRPRLQAGLQLLQTPEPDRDGGGGRGRGGAGTLLYDAVFLASNELMKKQQGRKALFILSDGVDRGSKESLEDAVESAQRADTSVYAILFTDDDSHDHGGYGGHNGGWGHGGYGGGGPGGGGPGGGGPGGGGRYPREERPDGKKVLERICAETGGQLFQVSKKLPIDQIYTQIEEELRNQYSLGYTPNPPNSGEGYHKIHLATKQKDLTVQARDGYYSDR
jgi:VWFA-related protein